MERAAERPPPGGIAAEAVLLRTMPELAEELEARGRTSSIPGRAIAGDYYALDWKPRPGAEADEAFR